MSDEKINHKYLLHLYSKVNDFLTSDKIDQDNLPDTIVSFCTVVEKVLKIKLHEKNPVLVFENSKIKDNDALIAIIDKKEKNVETTKIAETIDRFKLTFSDIFSDDELQALLDIYLIRNSFIHGYKSDSDILFEEEDVVKKLGTIWEKVSNQAIILFGKDNIKTSKPKKKYSEEELEKVLIEEVREKIKSTRRRYNSVFDLSATSFENLSLSHIDEFSFYNPILRSYNKQCPRCDSYGFYLDESNYDVFSASSVSIYPLKTFSGLYKWEVPQILDTLFSLINS